MRSYLLAAIMAATALVPAAALAQDRDNWRGRGGGQRGMQTQSAPAQPAPQARAEGGRWERPAAPQGNWADRGGDFRRDRADRSAPAAQVPVPVPAPQVQAQGQGQWQGNRGGDRRGWAGQSGTVDPAPRAPQTGWNNGGQGDPGNRWGGQRGGTRPDWNGRDNNGQGWDQRSDNRPAWDRRDNAAQRWDQRNDNRRNWDRRDDARQGWDRRNDNRRDWNRDWRRDNRYDYGSYRGQNRSLFHLPRYYAPYGWDYGYRRFSIGLSLNPILFEQDYWIDNPDYYRLPPAYGPYRWVRYYNDALLVDIYSGRVVDVVYDIFW